MKIEALIKNKEMECEILERKKLAMRTLSLFNEADESLGDTMNSRQFHRQASDR